MCNHCPHVLYQIENYLSPLCKVFYARHEVLEKVHDYLGPRVFISPSLKIEDTFVFMSSIQFYDHCEVMTKAIACLNSKIDVLVDKNKQLKMHIDKLFPEKHQPTRQRNKARIYFSKVKTLAT